MANARPRHYNDLRESSKQTYEYAWRDYERTARAAGVPVFAPGPFLEQYLEREAMISINRAKQRIRAIGYRFWLEGLDDPTRALPILPVLFRADQPAQARAQLLLGLVPRSARAYARYFADHQYAATTLTARRQSWESWRFWCTRHGVDYQHATPGELIAFLEARPRGYGAIRNLVGHLRHYFDELGLPAITEAPELDLYRERRLRARDPGPHPLFVEDLRKVVGAFGADRLDKRDHLIVLFGFFGPLDGAQQARLDVTDIAREADGVLVRVEGRDLFIDGYPAEPGLDIGRVYDAYRASVEWQSGRLFRALGLRGEYLPRMSPGAISMAAKNAANRAGVPGGDILRRFRVGMRILAARSLGVIVAAHRLGITPHALARHVPSVRAEIDAIERRPGRRRRRHASGHIA